MWRRMLFWIYHSCGHRRDEHTVVDAVTSPWGADGNLHKCRRCPCVYAT